MGRVRGSAGNMTGCKVYDKNVLRAKAFEVANPKTAAQTNQRKYFAMLSELTASFTEEQLRTLFPSKPKAMSRRNALSKQFAEDVTTSEGQKVVDYANIDTLGNAGTMDFGTTSVEWDGDYINIFMDASVENNSVLGNYYAFVALVNVTKKQIEIPSVFVRAADNDLVITKPQGWVNTDTINAIPFITDSLTAPSGFGTMGVMKRPQRKTTNQ